MEHCPRENGKGTQGHEMDAPIRLDRPPDSIAAPRD